MKTQDYLDAAQDVAYDPYGNIPWGYESKLDFVADFVSHFMTVVEKVDDPVRKTLIRKQLSLVSFTLIAVFTAREKGYDLADEFDQSDDTRSHYHQLEEMYPDLSHDIVNMRCDLIGAQIHTLKTLTLS
jgi:hypothetical protein